MSWRLLFEIEVLNREEKDNIYTKNITSSSCEDKMYMYTGITLRRAIAP